MNDRASATRARSSDGVGAPELDPLVDVVIAVHTAVRPIERPVGSVLDHTTAPVRVTVVVHNTDPEPIRVRLSSYEGDPRLRLVTWNDGIPSPSGPMNHGFDLAEAPFVSLLGSDDAFEPGAIDAWLRAAGLESVPAGTHGLSGMADVVIAPSREASGRLHPSPPVRARRIGDASGAGAKLLDSTRDRLAYRAAPLGLIGQTRFGHLRFAEGVETGEDQAFSAELWFTPGSRVVFPARAPGYREHHDQQDRVTFTERRVSVEFRILEQLLDPDSTWSRDPVVRLSLATKLIRVHLFDAARNRVGRSWSGEDAKELAVVAERILAWEPRARRLLARADERLLDALLETSTPEARLEDLLAVRRRLRSPQALLPKRLRYTFHSQAPLRLHAAGAWLARLASSRGA